MSINITGKTVAGLYNREGAALILFSDGSELVLVPHDIDGKIVFLNMWQTDGPLVKNDMITDLPRIN